MTRRPDGERINPEHPDILSIARRAGLVQPIQGWGPRGWVTQGGAPRKLGACPGLSSFAPLGLGGASNSASAFWVYACVRLVGDRIEGCTCDT
jgi:hypothetical protein